MADKLKEIPGKILGWWNNFTSKQKTIIIAIAAAVIFTFVILIYTFTKPEYTKLGTYENSTTSAEIVEILNSAGITHKESADALTVEVLVDQLPQANLAIAAEGYVPDDLKYNDYVDSGMSTTSADRMNQYTVFLAKYIENMFSHADSVKDVSVMLNLAQNTGRLTETKQESFATVMVTVGEDFTQAKALAMAKGVATCLGNESTGGITILDQNFNCLFAGGDDYSTMGIANSMQELQTQAELMVTNQVKKVLLGTKQYTMIEVASHLDVDFSNYTKEVTEYYTNDGAANGYLTHEDMFSEETTGGVAGIPGTDSNGGDLTGYDNPDYNGGSSTSNEYSRDYQLNKSNTVTIGPAGGIRYENSSLSVSMIKYREYDEETVKKQGLLDGGITWEQFKEENRESIKLEVEPEFYQMVANASGISEDKVTILAFEEPVFYDKEGFSVSGTDIASIVMIVLILALLAFVILRSMGPRKKEVEETEELSVENMLQSTPPEPTVEDIDLEAKSETRKMVEKFVDENPEAAANLLRNWLNEDWN